MGLKIRGGDGRDYHDRHNNGQFREDMGPGKGSGSKSYTRKEVDAGPKKKGR